MPGSRSPVEPGTGRMGCQRKELMSQPRNNLAVTHGESREQKGQSGSNRRGRPAGWEGSGRAVVGQADGGGIWTWVGGQDPQCGVGEEGRADGEPQWGWAGWDSQPGWGDEHALTLRLVGDTQAFLPNADHKCPVSRPMKASRAKVHLCCFRLLICF